MHHNAKFGYKIGEGMAELAALQTGNAGTILTRCVFESLVFHGIFLPVSTSSADCLMVSVQPLCAITCINNSVHVKNPKPWQPHHCMAMKILHTLIEMASAASAPEGTKKYLKKHKKTYI